MKKQKRIICKVCGFDCSIQNMSKHLRSKHGIVYKEYIRENIEDFHEFGWNICPYSDKLVKGKVSPEFLPQLIGDMQRGIPKGHMKEETKRKLSEGKKGEKHPFFGKKRDFMTDEIKKKIGKKAKERLKNKENHPMFGKEHSIDVKKKIGEKAKERLKDPKNNPMYGKTHSPETIKKIFERQPMNKLEKKVNDRLNELGIDNTFQFYITEGDICKIYDFKIKGKPALIEVDGDFWHGNPNTKSHCKEINEVRKNDKFKEELAERRGYIVYRLWETDINKDITVVDDVIDKIFV
jgi:very-short-patch-repair endonuclease